MDECVKILGRGRKREVVFCVEFCNTGRKIQLNNSDTARSIKHPPLPTIHRTNRRYILRCSKHVYRPLHKMWHGTVCFCADAYKLCHNQSIFKCLLLRLDTSLHSSNTVLIVSCYFPSFVFHFVALLQSESDLMYKSIQRYHHARLWFQLPGNRSLYTFFCIPAICKSDLRQI